MAHAEKCPVCGGTGKVPRDIPATDGADQACHGCGGLGWITIGVEHSPPIYYTIPYEQPYYPYHITDIRWTYS